MPDFGSAFGDQPALDELARTDLLLDALAERRPVRLEDFGDPDDDMLTMLLEDWRDNLRWPPASALVAPEEAIGALHAGLVDRRRARRGLAAIGSVAAALLVFSGLGAMVVEAPPGDTLYGLHAMFFDQRKVNENQVMLSAKADLAKVQQMIDEGLWDQAQSQLTEVSSMVQAMNDGADRNDLQNQLKLLSIRIESRNPEATLPPPAVSATPAWSTPASTAPSVAPTTSQPSSAVSTSPNTSAGQHRHHAHTTSQEPGAPGVDP